MTVQSAFTLDFGKTLDPTALVADADTVRLANGGFVVVGQTNATTVGGVIFSSSGIAIGNLTAGQPGTNASVLQLTDGRLAVVSEQAGTTNVRFYNSATGVEDAAHRPSPFANPGSVNHDAAALHNGGFAVAYQIDFSTDSDMQIDIWNSAGVRQETVVVDSSLTNDDTDPSVAVLANGNIAVAWTRTDNKTNETATMFAIYDEEGDQVVGPTIESDNQKVNRNPSIVATPAGEDLSGPVGAGFAIAYETDSRFTGSIDIRINAYDLNGTFGKSYNITNPLFNQTGEGDGTQNSDPYLAASPDGNLAVSYTRDGKNHVLTAVSDTIVSREVADTQIDFSNQDDGQTSPTVTFFGFGQLAAFHTDSKLSDIKGEHVFGFRDSFSDDSSDTYRGDDFHDLMNGTGGSDTISGGRNDDELQGGDGADTLHGDEGDDLLVGDGNFGDFDLGDKLFGDTGDDRLAGEAGDDTLDGGTGDDKMSGNIGNDTFIVDSLKDQVFEAAGEGTADVVMARATYVLTAGSAIETLRTFSNSGVSAIDLTGNELKQKITGNAGNNVLSDGGGAADTMQGLGGNDTYRVYNGADVIVETASQGTADIVNAAVSYALGSGVHIETLRTNSGSATKPINLYGNEVAQAITGNNGDNRLEGKGGADTLRGLGGADTFVFGSKLGGGNIDTILDFNPVDDRFLLSDAIFTKLTPGTITADQFRANNTGEARDATDRIVYDKDSGGIFYDADGLGGAAGVQFATVGLGLAITNADFVVV